MPRSKAVRESLLFDALLAKNAVAKELAQPLNDTNPNYILKLLEDIENALASALETEGKRDNQPSARSIYEHFYSRSYQPSNNPCAASPCSFCKAYPKT